MKSKILRNLLIFKCSFKTRPQGWLPSSPQPDFSLKHLLIEILELRQDDASLRTKVCLES